jgi:hypothetical protein
MKLPSRAVVCAAFLLAAVPTCAQAQDRVLPPLEYDHPYPGNIQMIIGKNDAEMLKYCPNQPAFNYPRVACTYRTQDTCIIVMATEFMIRGHGFDPKIVIRHERGHCNGWPPNHEGAR